MSEEGQNISFSIDMFDPSKADNPDPKQQQSLPVHQLQEIGAGDLLPSAGSLCSIHNLFPYPSLKHFE